MTTPHPTARLDSTALFHISFYKFVPLIDPDGVVPALRTLAADLLGSVLVAHEGINGVLAGPADALDIFERGLTGLAEAKGAFVGIVFKRSACRTAPFARLKIHRKNEIVALGVADVESCGRGGIDVAPAAWRALLADDNVVVIDNRNSFEFRLGRFRNAIDPKVENFRDFSAYMEAHAPAWKAEGKRVAMYCTGGIRCEKTSAWMADAGLEIYQLEGGILNYLQSMPDAARDWEGECFVFDNRIALDSALQETDTTAEDVYSHPEDAWRLARARRLDDAK
ncbi:MAG: hypothetical protein H7327_01865 [Herminiimonas sp.]|nr:hypothetical protein [Herminiimonas sp.]